MASVLDEHDLKLQPREVAEAGVVVFEAHGAGLRADGEEHEAEDRRLSVVVSHLARRDLRHRHRYHSPFHHHPFLVIAHAPSLNDRDDL